MKKNQKCVAIWLTDAEHDALTALASTQKKTITAYTTELARGHLRASDNEKEAQKREAEATREALEGIKLGLQKLREGLCYSTERTLTQHLNPQFKDEEEAHEWIMKFVGRRGV